jgi:hypothetical protein
MSVYSDVRASIRKGALAALSEFTNPQVIFSHGNGAEPAESYVVVNILNIEQQGHHSTSTRLNETTETQTIQASYEVMAQFSFVGSLSGDMSQSFTQRINNNYLVFEELGRNKLGIMRKSQIRRAPQKRDTKWVEYHNMDVTFSYTVCTTQVIDLIEAVIVENLTEPSIFRVPEGPIPPY